MDQSEDQKYEFKLSILGNEVLAVSLSTTSTSSRWILISLVSMFSFLIFLGEYGDNLFHLYQSLVK